MAAQAAVTRRWVVMMAACATRRAARLGAAWVVRSMVAKAGWSWRRRAAEKAWMAEAA